MSYVSASIEIGASPERIWDTLIDLERWQEWCPLFEMVRLHDATVGFAGGFITQGLLGRVPCNAEFMVSEYQPLQRFLFEAAVVSPPYNSLWHDVRLSDHQLTWTTSYSLSFGPGGWLVDRFLIRRQAQHLLDQTLDAFAATVAGGTPIPQK